MRAVASRAAATVSTPASKVMRRGVQAAAASSAPSSAISARLAAQILSSQTSVLSTGHYEALLRMAAPEDIVKVEERALGEERLRPLLRPLVRAYAASNQRSEAMRVLRRHSPEPSAFDPLLVACVASGDDADLRAAHWLMREAGIVPTAETYGELIRARLARGESDRAMRVCTHALEANRLPPPGAVADLVEALVEARLTGTALELAETLRLRHGVVLGREERATQLLLDGAAASPTALEVLSVMRELRQHRRADATHLLASDLLQRCLRAGNVPAARALWRECDAEGLPLTVESRDALLVAYLDRDELNEAMRVGDGAASPLRTFRAGPGVSMPDSSSGLPSSSIGPPLSLELDLRDMPEGAARLGCLRYFQRLANATPTETLLAGAVLRPTTPAISADDKLRLLISNPELASAVIRQAAELSPPITLTLADAPSGKARPPLTVLTAPPEELASWARRCAEERLRARRTSGLAVAAAGHNLAWTLALIGYAGLPF